MNFCKDRYFDIVLTIKFIILNVCVFSCAISVHLLLLFMNKLLTMHNNKRKNTHAHMHLSLYAYIFNYKDIFKMIYKYKSRKWPMQHKLKRKTLLLY